jgi:translation initiation factor 2A
MADVPATPTVQFATISKEGFQAYTVKSSISPIEGFSDPDGEYFEYSKDGSRIAVKKGDHVDIRNPETGKVIKSFHIPQLSEISLSPLGSYLLTFYSVKQGEEASEGNLVVWDTKTGEAVGKFVQKTVLKEAWPCIRWSQDESIAGRKVTNEIHFWTGGSVNGAPVQKLRVENVEDFSISPGKMNYYIGVFVGEKKNVPAEVRLYKYPQNRVLASKSFYADTAEFYWSPNGKHLLASVQTHVDRTGRSYYGQSGLYYLSEKSDCRVDTQSKKDGPVHNCAWRPDGLQFVGIYGFMPPKTTAFNLKSEPVLEYGVAHRNRVMFSPDGRLVWLAGLGGGLKGDMEFWNPNDLKKYGVGEASPSAVHCEWAPDSLHVMTAILSPRMRVDNGFQIWDYQGNLVHKQEFSALYFVQYRPSSAKLFPKPQLKINQQQKATSSAGAAAKKPTAYRHSNYRGGSESTVSREVKSEEAKPKKYTPPSQANAGPVGIPGDYSAPPQNQGKRKNRRKKKPQDGNNNSDLPPGY